MIDSITVICTACQVTNRLPAIKVGQIQPNSAPIIVKCGKCGEPLQLRPLEQPIAATDQTFDEAVMQSSLPVLVDFWAPWCAPCGILTPSLDHLAREFAGKLRIVKVNSDENSMVARRYQVRSIPTMLLFQEGKIIQQMVGAIPLGQLRNWINKSLGWL